MSRQETKALCAVLAGLLACVSVPVSASFEVHATRIEASRGAGKAVAEITEAALAKGNKFFEGFAKRNPFDQTTRPIGRFTEFAVSIPGRVQGSFTRWVKVVDPTGKTVRLHHDTFDKTGTFINRGVKVPGPERHIQ